MCRLFLTFFILLISCGGSVFNVKTPVSSQLGLGNKSQVYRDLVTSHQDSNGFILTEHCDSLLFSGLLGAAVPGLVNIYAAEDSEGAWHRRPSKDCGPEFGNSRSTISRDMIIGLMWYMWRNEDLLAAEKLMDQLKSNLYWLKGQGTIGELLITPAMLNTLAQMIKKMGGEDYSAELLFPVVFSKDTGYIAHLTVLHIHLRGEILGSITENEFKILEFHAERNEKNPLFQAAYHKYLDGDQAVAVQLLLDETEWPADRLPTTNEHCDDWPVQRDYTPNNWEPCEGNKEHTGAELIIIYELFIKVS